MALVRDISEAQLSFQFEGGEADQFLVLRYRGNEGLCQLYRFDIELASVDSAAVFEDLVGKAAVLGIQTLSGQSFFHGVVSRFEMTGESADQTYYRAELVPQIWLLTHRYNCRIFQNKAVGDIITDVLDAAGVPADRYSITLQGAHETREYCVQYRETDYNFIARLMEEEGIRWRFEHTSEAHKLIIEDAETYPPIEGDPAIPYHATAGLTADAEYVTRFRYGQCVRPGAVALRDFTFANPALDLSAAQDAGRDAGLEFYDYPGGYETQEVGTTLAGHRIHEFQTGRLRAVGLSNSGRLHPGLTFELAEHPCSQANGSYMVTSITHQGKQSTTLSAGGSNGHASVLARNLTEALTRIRAGANEQLRELADALLHLAERIRPGDVSARRMLTSWLYHAGQVARDVTSAAAALGGNPLEALTIPNLIDDLVQPNLMDLDRPIYECSFECIPADVPYCPPRVSPWPVMRGSQTAIVVGEGSEEITTDEFGRVKVKFHWDRRGKYDDTASCWIRVAHGWAGGQYGMLFIPRVGQEVVVDFLEGNPDKPIITGRVYNQDCMPAYKLPDEKTKSYIKTNSSKGGGGTNEIRFEDLKDQEQVLINAQKDFHIRVGNQERHNVKENQFLIVEGEQRVRIDGARSAAVGGKDALEVADEQSIVCQADVYYDFKGNHDHVVASEYHIKADKLVVEADSGVSLKCGGNFVLIDSSGVTIVGTKIKLNSGGSALSSSISGSPASPASPEDADEVTPGKDVSYTGEAYEMPPIEEEPIKGQWISIDMKDPEGNPRAGEYYEITTPGGLILEGTLDVNGYAKRWVDEEGECQITFPRLDAEEWQRG